MHFSYRKLLGLLLCFFCLTGCSSTPNSSVSPEPSTAYRDNTPVCFVPSADGTEVLQNEFASIDISNIKEGYIMVKYTGSADKVKLQITGADRITYTYNLTQNEFDAFPLSAGSGAYDVGVYENVTENLYSVAFSETIQADITNTFGPFLYANQYVVFDADSLSTAKARELAEQTITDLDVVSSVYNFVISTIEYDYDKAASVESGYTPVADETLTTKKGICLDYASLMTGMLRSQNIPTRLEVGYAGENYHAWISTYIPDVGWVNGIIHFNGEDWQLMDPTFAATGSEKELKSFIEDGNNYTVKYRY